MSTSIPFAAPVAAAAATALLASRCCRHSLSRSPGSLQSRALRGKDGGDGDGGCCWRLSSLLSPSLSLSSSEDVEREEEEAAAEPPPLFFFLLVAASEEDSRPEAASGSAASRLGASVALAVTRPSGIARRGRLSGVAGGGHAGKKKLLSEAWAAAGAPAEAEACCCCCAAAGGGGWSSTAVVSASTGSPGIRSKSTPPFLPSPSPPILTMILPERSTNTLPSDPGWRSEAQASEEAESCLLSPRRRLPAAAVEAGGGGGGGGGGGERLPPKEASIVGRREGTWSRQKPPSSSLPSPSPPEPKAERGTVVGCFFFFSFFS